jgi:hypothetical protein
MEQTSNYYCLFTAMESQEESIEPLPKKMKTLDSSKKKSESDADKSELAAPKNGVVVEVDSQSGVST